MRRLDALRHLRRPGDVGLLLRIFFFIAAVPMLLRLRLPRLEALLTPRRICSCPHTARVQEIIRAVDAVLHLGRPLLRPGCLSRGLTLYYFLRKAGLDVALCFGIGTLNGECVGHCWLVQAGEPFLEARDPRPLFTAVYTFPAGAPLNTAVRLIDEGRAQDR
jgi:Transglutaminase-like superfamily